MSLPDILFKGIPRRWTRGFTKELIEKTKPERVIVPCAGAFSLVATAVKAGVKPENIHACDISLYSSVLGTYFASRGMVRDEFMLSVKVKPPFEWLMPYRHQDQNVCAAVIVGIRLAQYLAKKQSVYRDQRIRELQDGAAFYLEQARRSVESMREELKGIHYAPRDMWALLAEHVDDPDTLILCNPPRYTGGYDKMYAGVEQMFTWNAPGVAQFDESQYAKLMDYLGNAAARSLVYYATPVETSEDPQKTFGPPWRSVFAERPRTGKTAAINWILINRIASEDAEPVLRRADTGPAAVPRYPMFTHGTVTEASRLEVRAETKAIVSYYRDLLVHRLGLTNAESHQVLLLDGQLVAAVGLHLANYHRAMGAANLTFCFSPQHERYPRLQKLALLSVASSWFWDGVLKNALEERPYTVATTMLTDLPEVKTARGIFKLAEREALKAGGYKLHYTAEVQTRTADETVQYWLKKWGKQERVRKSAPAGA